MDVLIRRGRKKGKEIFMLKQGKQKSDVETRQE